MLGLGKLLKFVPRPKIIKTDADAEEFSKALKEMFSEGEIKQIKRDLEDDK